MWMLRQSSYVIFPVFVTILSASTVLPCPVRSSLHLTHVAHSRLRVSSPEGCSNWINSCALLPGCSPLFTSITTSPLVASYECLYFVEYLEVCRSSLRTICTFRESGEGSLRYEADFVRHEQHDRNSVTAISTDFFGKYIYTYRKMLHRGPATAPKSSWTRHMLLW